MIALLAAISPAGWGAIITAILFFALVWYAAKSNPMGLVVLTLVSYPWDARAASKDGPDGGVDPNAKADFGAYSTLGTLLKKGTDRLPIVGVRAQADIPWLFGTHLLGRADFSAMSDGKGVQGNAADIKSFETLEGYGALYRPVWGPVSLEVVGGIAYPLVPDGKIIETNDWLAVYGAGVRLRVGNGAAFVGVGGHDASGKGPRVLVSALVQGKDHVWMLVDGAAADRQRSVLRTGLAYRW